MTNDAERKALADEPKPNALDTTLNELERVTAEWRKATLALEKEQADHLGTIDRRDDTEECVGNIYFKVIGHSPEWSNNFGYAEALEEIEDAVSSLKAVAALRSQPAMPRELSDDDLMKLFYKTGLAKRSVSMITTDWKDGIDIDRPSYYARRLVDAILSLPAAPANGGREALEPFAKLGGPNDGILPAFHDLADDVVICENSGAYVTAGDVREARRAIGWLHAPWSKPPNLDEDQALAALQCMSDTKDGNEILGALLWARNYIDVGSVVPSKDVIARLDRVLNKYDVSGKDVKAFREAYPVEPK